MASVCDDPLEVLEDAVEWYDENVFSPIVGPVQDFYADTVGAAYASIGLDGQTAGQLGTLQATTVGSQLGSLGDGGDFFAPATDLIDPQDPFAGGAPILELDISANSGARSASRFLSRFSEDPRIRERTSTGIGDLIQPLIDPLNLPT